MLDDFNRTDITFSVKYIDHACAFVEALVHIKGQWAGQAIRLEPFQVWIIANIFGWVRNSDGLRRFRSAFVLLPRKSGKSLIAAAIALYMVFADGEPGAEGYCGATNLAQASEVFGPAKRMAELSPGFLEAFDVEVMAKSVFSETTGQSFVPVIAKTKDGSSPHLAICDELHQAIDDTQIQAFRTGMGARRQPLLLVISTAGTNLAGVCRTEQLAAEAVLRGGSIDDKLFAAIWTIDADDDWRDFDSWIKANPAIGASLSEEFLRDKLNEALQSPAKAAAARTKHLNEWVASAAGWLNQNDWANAADPTLDIMTLAGRPAFLAADLSTKQDLTSINAAVPLDDGRLAIFPWCMVPEGAVTNSPNSSAYAEWVERGDLIQTPGSASSFAEAEERLEWLRRHFDVRVAVFDQWQGEAVRQRYEAAGVPTMIWQANNRGAWTMAMDDFEADLKNGLVVHPANAVLDWCAANVCASTRGVTRIPVKPSGQDHLKIDAMVATIMAYAAASVEPPPARAEIALEFWD